MRETQDFSLRLIRQFSICAALLVMAGCATNGPLGGEEPLPAKVVRLKGAARWSSDDGTTWREIKAGSKLLPGALVQTAAKSRIDIELGDSTTPAGYCFVLMPEPVQVHMPSSTSFPRRNDPADTEPLKPGLVPNSMMRLWENSQLNLDRLTRRLTKVGTHIAEQGQFDLRAGHIFFRFMKLASDSQYEIRFPKGVIRVRNGVCDLTADGVLRVLAGRVSVTISGSTETHEVSGGHMFDTRTGALSSTPDPHRHSLW